MRLQMEAYLDDNPDFTESYVMRKVGRKTIEKWLQLHTGTYALTFSDGTLFVWDVMEGNVCQCQVQNIGMTIFDMDNRQLSIFVSKLRLKS